MRLALGILIVSALIYLGWDKSFHDWLLGSEPAADITAPVVRATPPPSQPAWMHDPNHRTALDTPAPANAHAGANGGGWMFDPNHRSPLDPSAHPSASTTPH